MSERKGMGNRQFEYVEVLFCQESFRAETEGIFSTLMGEDVESRGGFIEDNAPDVRNLDVWLSSLITMMGRARDPRELVWPLCHRRQDTYDLNKFSPEHGLCWAFGCE